MASEVASPQKTKHSQMCEENRPSPGLGAEGALRVSVHTGTVVNVDDAADRGLQQQPNAPISAGPETSLVENALNARHGVEQTRTPLPGDESVPVSIDAKTSSNLHAEYCARRSKAK